MDYPARVSTSSCIVFGGNLDTESDRTLRKLLQPPSDMESFSGMMKSVMSASVTVLDRQYKNYFGLDLSERLAEETWLARSHNMDAEEIVGMSSALRTVSDSNNRQRHCMCRLKYVTEGSIEDVTDALIVVKLWLRFA